MAVEFGEVQMKFAELIWGKEPVGSGELVRLCAEMFGWKKSTTYTVLKRLGEKGLIQNEHGTVTAAITKTAYEAFRSEQVVNEQFHGSLPAFIAAFTAKNTLSEDDIAEIRRMIDGMKRTPEGGDSE